MARCEGVAHLGGGAPVRGVDAAKWQEEGGGAEEQTREVVLTRTLVGK
jgi:hypothetical protein